MVWSILNLRKIVQCHPHNVICFCLSMYLDTYCILMRNNFDFDYSSLLRPTFLLLVQILAPWEDICRYCFTVNPQFLISGTQGHIVEQPARWYYACKVIVFFVQIYALKHLPTCSDRILFFFEFVLQEVCKLNMYQIYTRMKHTCDTNVDWQTWFLRTHFPESNI